MKVRRVHDVIINKDHFMYPWCDNASRKANNLKNAVRFRQRQVLTARSKDSSSLTVNEKEVVEEILRVTEKNVLCTGNSMTYNFLYHLMQDGHNPDYYADGITRQTAQQVIKRAVEDMDAFYEALETWKKAPSKFNGKPKLPGYAKKGGLSTFVVTNQDCTVKFDGRGRTLACLPYAKKTPVCIGHTSGILKEVIVVPCNGVFKMQFVFEREIPDYLPGPSERIASVDFGVENLMAVTNNVGALCLLYKGGILKSENRFYNKQLAEIMAREMSKPGCPLTKDGRPKFVPTDESREVTLRRDCFTRDFMHKTSCHFIRWCVENRIDTIVLGVNRWWKRNVNIGGVNNQNFVQIPFALLRDMIVYKANETGIAVVLQEESYTSKASFLDNDQIPVYGEEEGKTVFSGKRAPSHYKGMYRKGGFRGLYRSKDGTVINSDLNGSANILRKAFPHAFKEGVMPDFTKAVIIRNPDTEFIVANRMKQGKGTRPFISRSKAHRLNRKLA